MLYANWITILYLKELEHVLSLKGEKLYWMGFLYEVRHALLYAFSENVLINNCKIPSKKACQNSSLSAVRCHKNGKFRIEVFLKATSLTVAFPANLASIEKFRIFSNINT